MRPEQLKRPEALGFVVELFLLQDKTDQIQAHMASSSETGFIHEVSRHDLAASSSLRPSHLVLWSFYPCNAFVHTHLQCFVAFTAGFTLAYIRAYTLAMHSCIHPYKH